MREIKSDGGKTTFEIEIDLLETDTSNDSPETVPPKE